MLKQSERNSPLMRKFGLDPVMRHRTQILILGSMPSETSLEKQQYYGNPLNQFWRILAVVYDITWTGDYKRDIGVLQKHQIGLWDVIASCQRAGSLDANITGVAVNDFAKFLLQYSNIKLIACNGGTAYRLFNRHCVTTIPVVQLPSSSPAHTLALEQKIKEWRRLLQFSSEG